MNEFFEKKGIKVFCVYLNPMIIGIILPFILGSWSDKGVKFYLWLIVGIILSACYIYTSYRYFENDKNDKNKKRKLENEISKLTTDLSTASKEAVAFDKGMRELATLFYDSSNSLNKTSGHILDGDTTLDLWNFKKVSIGICSSIYNLLCEMCKPYDDFTVNIMLADASATGQKRNITMIAHKGKYEKYPGKFEEKLYFNKHNTFYAVKVCKSGNTEIRILTTKEEVNEKFVYIEEEHPEYNQYIGIPIVCSGNKIICLLQICAFGSSKIAESKADILKLITKYIFPFTHYALLTYKVEKSLISSFSVIDRQYKEEELK